MNILLVQDSDWIARGPHQQHHLMERLALRGHKIRVIDYEILWRTHGIKGLYSKRTVSKNVCKVYKGARITVIHPGIIKIPLVDYITLVFTHGKEIRRQVKEFSPDVIIGLGILGSYLAARIAKRNNIPFVYYWIDVLHRLLAIKSLQPIAKALESRTLKRASRVLTITNRLRTFVIKLGAPPDLSQVLSTGIDINQFNPQVDTTGIRESYGLKQDDIVLFFMGWLYTFSGLKEVAQQLVKVNNPKIKLLIVGEGDDEGKLRRIRDTYSLSDRLILTGKRPYKEMPTLIASSDICLLPAILTEEIMQDIVPIKVYEYMAMGKPTIATALPSIVEELGMNNGIVYIDNPINAIEVAIELVQSGNLKELGARARSFAEKHDWENITNELEQILKDLNKKGTLPN